MPAKKMHTRPEDLAKEIGVSGKIVRSFLRATFPRPAEAKNTSWVLTPKMNDAVRSHFAKRQAKNA